MSYRNPHIRIATKRDLMKWKRNPFAPRKVYASIEYPSTEMNKKRPPVLILSDMPEKDVPRLLSHENIHMVLDRVFGRPVANSFDCVTETLRIDKPKIARFKEKLGKTGFL